MHADATTRSQIVKSILEHVQNDPDFRERCINEPEGVLTEACREVLGANFSFPEGTQFEIITEPLNKVCLVIPEASAAAGELSLDELQSAAGGRGKPPLSSVGDDMIMGDEINNKRSCTLV
jgi:hypothetical protein